MRLTLASQEVDPASLNFPAQLKSNLREHFAVVQVTKEAGRRDAKSSVVVEILDFADPNDSGISSWRRWRFSGRIILPSLS